MKAINNLNNILKTHEDIGLELLELGFEDNNVRKLNYIKLVDVRSYNWEIIFEVYEDKCIVIENNYDCALIERSNETTKTFDESLKMASEWC